MAMKNPYDKYTNNVFTAPKEELTLKLYEGALKFANQGIVAIENQQFDSANALIIKVENIIREFQVTLDRKYEVSNYLASMYEYIYRKLVEANIRKDIEALSEARDLIRDLRDTWKEAMKLAKQGQ